MNKIAVFAVVLASATASAQEGAAAARAERDQRLSATLETLRARHRLPALAAARLEAGRIITAATVGKRAWKSEAAVTLADAWHLGSCGKAMTATLMARLVERKKIRWDTSLAEGLPHLAKTMQPAYRDVTLAQLLGHRAGLAKSPPPALWRDLVTTDDPPRATRARFVAAVLAGNPACPPGTEYRYSNSGYVIAGTLAEHVTGRTYEELMRTEVFTPLGMSGAGFGAPGGNQRIDEPRGHTNTLGIKRPLTPGRRADNPPALAPAGTIHMPLADWARFIAAHLGHGPDGYLRPETFATLHRPLPDQDYALGWSTTRRPWAGGLVLTHAGSNTFWFAVVWVAPERDLAVMAVTNSASAAACDEAVSALILDPAFRDR